MQRLVWPLLFAHDKLRISCDEAKILPPALYFRLFPFGLGARVCVGKDFAKVRLFVYLVALVQRFDILPPTEVDLISCDPRLYHSGAVLQMDRFSCRFVPK